MAAAHSRLMRLSILLSVVRIWPNARRKSKLHVLEYFLKAPV